MGASPLPARIFGEDWEGFHYGMYYKEAHEPDVSLISTPRLVEEIDHRSKARQERRMA